MEAAEWWWFGQGREGVGTQQSGPPGTVRPDAPLLIDGMALLGLIWFLSLFVRHTVVVDAALERRARLKNKSGARVAACRVRPWHWLSG